MIALPASTTMVMTAAAGLAVGAGAVAAYATVAPRSGLWGPVVWRGGAAAGNRVALTFDDGPWGEQDATARMLEALAELGVRAAFFVIGCNVVRWPDLVRRAAAEGHLVGNHTFDHRHLGVLRGRRFWLDQLDRTDDAIERATGTRPRIFRPPLGLRSPASAWAARRRGYRVVTWSRRAFDGVPVSPETIVRRLGPACEGGDIVTLHDGLDPHGRRTIESTLAAIRPLVRALRARGLEPARLDEVADLA